MTPLPALAAMAALAKACVAVALAEVCYALVAAHTLAKACTLVAAAVFLDTGVNVGAEVATEVVELDVAVSLVAMRIRAAARQLMPAHSRRKQSATLFLVLPSVTRYCRVYKVGSLPINLKPTVASLCLHLDS